MENGADALLIGFAVLIFIIAISVAFSTLSQAKTTADKILYLSDKKNFQKLLTSGTDSRIVNVDTVVATIYRCTKEKFSVKIIEGSSTVYNFEYDVDTADEIEQKINDFVKSKDMKSTYTETYIEVSTGGTTYTGADGSQLEEDVSKKIYITYVKN